MMRMTREAYAREVWKTVQLVLDGENTVRCPHEDCQERILVLATSVRTGTTLVCPMHGVIYRE